MSVHGWIILDKPIGLGSTQAVSAVKRVLRAAGYKVSGKGPGKVKVGHGGTLDPLATGVLPIALGEATKLTGWMLDATKRYDFTISFGTETAGLDAEGNVVATSDVRPTAADIEAVLSQFTGLIEQIPPIYSAIKIDGKRAYDLARAGEEIEMAARRVEVFSLKPSQELGNEPLSSITLSAHVSKGTYIRSLARDIAHAVGTVGHVSMLRRTQAGPFSLDQAISLDKLEELAKGAAQQNIILPLEAGLVDIPALDLSPEAAGAIRQGRVLTGIIVEDGIHLARDAEMRPLALVEAKAGMLTVLRGFNI
jgi:tRNA pseudouridine55 synthase